MLITEQQELEGYMLINLYREFSMQTYHTNWIGDPRYKQKIHDKFVAWLSDYIKNTQPQYYEVRAIPSLKSCYAEAMECILTDKK